MASTVTAFTTFTSGTPARSAEVNNNFSNFRGDLISIFANTQAAGNLDHDLGLPSHRWKDGYIRRVFFGDTTVGWNIQDETTTSARLVFRKNSSDSLFLGNGSMLLRSTLSTSNGIFAVDSSLRFIDATTGNTVVRADQTTFSMFNYSSGNLIFEIDQSGGVNGSRYTKSTTTITSSLGIALSETVYPAFDLSITAGNYAAGLYVLGFTPKTPSVGATASAISIEPSTATTTAYGVLIYRFDNGTIVYSHKFGVTHGTGNFTSWIMPCSAFTDYVQLTSGSYTLNFSYIAQGGALQFLNAVPFVKRIL